MNEALAVLKDFDRGGNRQALAPIDQAIQQAQGNPARLAEIENKLLALLDPAIPRPAQEFICRRLALMGSNHALPILGKLLLVAETTDMARYALERLPGPAASETLRAALAKTQGKVRIGIMDSLGQRRDRVASKMIGAFLQDPSYETINAAATALGWIGDTQACAILEKARDTVPPPCRNAVLDATLRCAEELQTEGKTIQARKIYTELTAPDMPKAIQYAARQGLEQLKTKEANREIST